MATQLPFSSSVSTYEEAVDETSRLSTASTVPSKIELEVTAAQKLVSS